MQQKFYATLRGCTLIFSGPSARKYIGRFSDLEIILLFRAFLPRIIEAVANMRNFVPHYSSGTVSAFHRLPFIPLETIDRNFDVSNGINLYNLYFKKIAFGDSFKRFSQWYRKVLYTFLHHERTFTYYNYVFIFVNKFYNSIPFLALIPL